MNSLDITKYLDIAARRIYWILIPFLVTVLAGMGYLLNAPKIYKAETLILVQPQKVPEEYIREIVSIDVDARLKTISQQVTSRTNLERIISEYSLYEGPEKSMGVDEKVETMRQNVSIEVSKSGQGRAASASAFTISFMGENPEKVMRVTNALASNFISENLKIRESQALGTSGFLADELESVEKKLMEKEEQLKNYREKYMGGLPEQLESNLRILERLQSHLDQLNGNLRDAENRRFSLQKEVTGVHETVSVPAMPGTARDSATASLLSLKQELASLEARYTENHPDVIRLREMIANLEKREEKGTGNTEGPPSGSSAGTRVSRDLANQVQSMDAEIGGLKVEIGQVKGQMKVYQSKVEETPKREQELLSLNRDYENLKELYNSLLNRKLEAELAVSMEKKQKGEQFRVIDPAKIPSRPVKPDMMKVSLMILALGLGLGGGLAYLMETMDTSFRDPHEVEKDLGLPILVSLPIRYTEKEIRSMKRRKILLGASVAVGFIVCAGGIVFATKGVDATLRFVKTLLDKI